MQSGFRGGRLSVRRVAGVLLTALAVGVSACEKGGDVTEPPVLPPNPPLNPAVGTAAFIFDVDVRKGTVKVTSPSVTLPSLRQATRLREGMSASVVGPDYSLVGGDVIELVTGAFDVTSGGGFGSGSIPVGPCPGGSPAPITGKLCVEFDVQVINELLGVQLTGPAVFPAAPAGSAGPLFFPFAITLTPNVPGTTVGGPQGNDVIVELPNTGEVAVNEEWAGAPFNFFNDASCPAGSGGGTSQGESDCYRWEEVTPNPLTGGAASDFKRVGFYLDPTVGNFRVRVLVAADLQNQSGSASGTIAGTVTSPQLSALSGVDVNVTGGFTGPTDGTGAYSISGVGLGSRTVSLDAADLPAGCVDPGSQTTTVTNGGTSTVDFIVTCPVAVGTITGTISSSLGGGLAGVNVIVTPAGGSALSAAPTNGSGVYTKTGVPLGTPSGTGSLALTGLPAGCTDPGTTPYSGLTNAGTITVDLTITCVPPPAAYNLNGAWSGTGSTRAYTLTYDLTGLDDPAIPGPDDVFVISGTTTYDNTKLAFTTSANVAGSLLQNQGSNQTSPGSIAWQNFDTDPAEATGNVGVIIFNFTVNAGATGTVTPNTTFGALDDVQSENGVDLKPNTVINDATLTLP